MTDRHVCRFSWNAHSVVVFRKQNEKRVSNVLGWCEILMIANVEKIGQKLLKFPTANQMVLGSVGSPANDPRTADWLMTGLVVGLLLLSVEKATHSQ